MSKENIPIFYHLCPRDTLLKIVYGGDNEFLSKNEISLGLTRLYPCKGENGELRRSIDTLKDILDTYWFKNNNVPPQTAEEIKHFLDSNEPEKNLPLLFKLIYEYPYYFYEENSTIHMYTISLTTKKGLENTSNWARYAKEDGVAIALDLSDCKKFDAPKAIDEARQRVYDRKNAEKSHFIQSSEGHVAILAPISYNLIEKISLLEDTINIFNDTQRGNDTYRMALRFALNDLIRKGEKNLNDKEERLFCVYPTDSIYKQILEHRGIIPVGANDDKPTYSIGKNSSNKEKCLLRFRIPYSCIKKIYYINDRTKTEIKEKVDSLIEAGKIPKEGAALTDLLELYRI